jgi:hypothetical protein
LRGRRLPAARFSESDPQFGQSPVLIGLDLAGVGRGLQVRT